MKKNTGKQFEELVHEIYSTLHQSLPNSSVKINEFVEGPDGDRQIDILIQVNIGGIEYLTIVECKDFAKPVNVTVVDAFHSKINDLKGNKGILVSRNGFSKNAVHKANRLGIDTCIADSAKNILPNLAQEVPIIVKRVFATAFMVGGVAKGADLSKAGLLGSLKDALVNGIPPLQLLLIASQSGKLMKVNEHPRFHEWKDNFEFIIDLKDVFGEGSLIFKNELHEMEIRDGVLALNVKEKWYFGHSKDMKSAIHLIDMKKKMLYLSIRADDFDEVPTSLCEFDNFESMPPYARREHLFCIVVDTKMDIVENYTFAKQQ